ncbi:DUF3363 domain-containing protein [Sphingomonas agri]|uniref:DUF3363 domain-containing protein n=1 Tax=Sphingomonas agri TaxID=1813878 RepID=UPI00311FB6C4
MEDDLETRLEWVAANHANRLFPHAHLMLRGKDEHAENLVIAPDYLFHGMRERLAGIVSLDLGPRTDLEVKPDRLEVCAERLTSIDRRLMRDMDDCHVVRSMGRDMVDHAIRTGRLRKLESMGLARELRGGRWELSAQLERNLGRIAERHETARTMQRVLRAAGLERAPGEQLIYNPSARTKLTGRVLAHGREDDQSNNYLIVDGVDGRVHCVNVGTGLIGEPLPKGAIIRVEPSTDLAPDTEDRPPHITLLSPVPLEELAGQKGATWLDEELSLPAAAARDQGFGRQVRIALAQRRAVLLERGLASVEGDEFECRPDMLRTLRAMAIQQASIVIEQETGLDFKAAPPGSHVEGKLRQRLDLPSGQFGVIEGGHEFFLVPWHPELARAIGDRVSVLVRDREIGWTIGRGLELEL